MGQLLPLPQLWLQRELLFLSRSFLLLLRLAIYTIVMRCFYSTQSNTEYTEFLSVLVRCCTAAIGDLCDCDAVFYSPLSH
jgi:hypothetical protein